MLRKVVIPRACYVRCHHHSECLLFFKYKPALRPTRPTFNVFEFIIIIIMNTNTSHIIDDKVMLATSRIQAALDLVSRIEGPKEDWGPWMRDHLKSEQVSISKS